jgi:hypothetical protein
MAKNYNIDPYYDDFNPDKNFHRILFKPGVAVQARELTQSQTILQNQISNFASAIYSQNTPISGGNVTTNLNCSYIKLNSTYNNATVIAAVFLNQKIVNSTGTVVAQVIATSEATGNATAAGDPPTLIVTYTSGTKFSDGMTIYISDGETTYPAATTIGTAGGTTSIGSSSVVSISKGVFWVVNGYNTIQNADGTSSQFQIGNFVNVLPQTAILDKYDNTPSLRAGLQIVEETITYTDDDSLLDPATGSTNFQAPGADRYKISLTLTTKALAFGDDSEFIELVRYDAGQIVKQSDQTVYSAIDDYFAKRDFETNGDYVVNDFKLTPTPSANTANTNYYDLIIGKGVAYVHGYRVENQSNKTISIPRARTVANVVAGSNNTFINYGSYFIVDTANGNFDTSMPLVDIHSVAANSINTTTANSYTSTLIGTGFLRGTQYVYTTGASTNTKNYVFNAFVSELATTSLSSNANTTVSATSGGTTTNWISFFDKDYATNPKFSATANAYYGATIRITSGTSVGDSRIITGYNGTTKTANVNLPFTVAPDTTSQFSIIFDSGQANTFVQKGNTGGTGAVASPVYKIKANSSVNIATGKLNGVPTGPAVLYNSGTPEMIFNLGNKYVANNTINSAQFFSTQVWRNQTFNGTSKSFTINTSSPLYFQGTAGTTYFGESFKALFTVYDAVTGDILDFSTGANTATVNTSTSVTFNSNDYTTRGNPVTVVAQVYASIAGIGDSTGVIQRTKTKITGNNSYVTGNSFTAIASTALGTNTNVYLDTAGGQTYILANAVSNTAASISLYVSDVKKITAIIDTGAPGTSIFSSGTTGNGTAFSNYRNITSSYSLDTGQRDGFYDHASIKLKPGASAPIGNILVAYDYYAHSGGDGYFTVSSYVNETYSQIPSYTTKAGTLYQLRDSIDFRPSRQNGVTSYTWNYKSSPSTTSGGLFFPQNRSNFTAGYNYYLGRKDKLVLTKDSQFVMVLGTPASSPVYPVEPDDSLLLANFNLDPYTAFVPGEGSNYVSAESTYGITQNSTASNLSFQKVLHKRWAKSDISDLQTQVNNLEYYTSLSLLESNANSLQVPDVNGLNRFKNGILVDDFSSFGTADTTQNNFRCNINIRKKTLSPLQYVENFQLQNAFVNASYGSNTTPTSSFTINGINNSLSNIYTLPYTIANVAVQQLASNTISVNPFGVINYQGVCLLNPPLDNWINTFEVPNIVINDPKFNFAQQSGGTNLTNSGDYASLVGTNLVPTADDYTNIQQNYASQTTGFQNATKASTAAPTPLSVQNGYVNNDGVQAYIRPQEVIVRAKGLQTDAILGCYFDGLNVDKYMTIPDSIELTGVKGKFNEDDIIGFYDTNISKFFPVGRVVSVYNYPTNNQTRLYIADFIQTPNTVSSSANLINAYFGPTGTYLSTTASGNVKVSDANSILSMSTSGLISGIGGQFTTVAQTSPSYIYKTQKLWGTTEAGTIINNYGVWGNPNNNSPYNGGAWKMPITANGTYTLKVVTNASGTINFGNTGTLTATADPGTILTLSKNFSGGGAFFANSNTNISWTLTTPGTVTAAIGATVTDANNIVVWNSVSPAGLLFSSGATSNIAMPGGGNYYDGVTSINFAPNASAANNFYTGGALTIKTSYAYQYNYAAEYLAPPPEILVNLGYRTGDGDAGRPWAMGWADDTAAIAANKTKQDGQKSKTALLVATTTMTANITNYYGPTRTATLDVPVAVSIGNNSEFGNLTSAYSIRGSSVSLAGAKAIGNTIPALSSDENGNFTAVFNMPGSQFFSGNRVFRVDNRVRSTNNPSTATTFAEATFFASGAYRNTGTSSPSVDSSALTFTPQSKQGYNIVSLTAPMDPLAQTFILDKKNYPNGAYLYSTRLFFAPYTTVKKPTVPVTVSLVETLNGYPTGKVLDYSTTIINASDIRTSNTPHYLDSTTWTEFVFDAPVYVQSGVLYAFMVNANSTDYLLYYGGQNELAVASSAKALPTDANPSKATKIGATPYVGSLFESQNSLTWTADQGKSLMFVLNACKFDTTKTPDITFSVSKNLPMRKVGSQGLSYAMNANTVNNLQGNFAPTQSLHAFNLTTTDFAPTGTSINYTYSSLLASDQTKTAAAAVTPGRFGNPLPDDFYLSDGKGSRLLLKDSSASFDMIATMSSTDPWVTPIISDDGTTLYSIQYSINNMGIPPNVISVANTGNGYSNLATVVITSGLTGSNTQNDFGVNDLPVFGYTTNAISGSIQSVFTTYRGSGYVVTPTITISDPTTRQTGNANAVITISGETSPSGGNGLARYITKKVVLQTGNESGDLRVYLSAYKPVGSQVYVYYKIINAADSAKMEDQPWQLMAQSGRPGVYSSDRTNVIEYEYAPGNILSNLANNAVQYTSVTTGTTYNSFNQFVIKVVLAASDPTNTPILTDIRALALPSGTGI